MMADTGLWLRAILSGRTPSPGCCGRPALGASPTMGGNLCLAQGAEGPNLREVRSIRFDGNEGALLVETRQSRADLSNSSSKNTDGRSPHAQGGAWVRGDDKQQTATF